MDTTQQFTIPTRDPEKGRQCFAIMLSRWVDSNEWTYNQVCQFARAVIGESWLHPSQVSGLRQAKLEGPNPKVFAALWEVNQALVRWHNDEIRPGGGIPAEFYEDAQIWTNDEGSPINLHELLTMFLGYWEPAAYRPMLIPAEWAPRISKNLGRLIRTIITTRGEDLIDGWENFDRCYAPVDVTRRNRLKVVAMGQDVYSPEELAVELSVISEALQEYSGVTWTPTELAERLEILPAVPPSGHRTESLPGDAPAPQLPPFSE